MEEKIIAIVEDDINQRQHYAEALRNCGYKVVEYSDRSTALKAFEQSLPDLAILDIMLGEDVGGGFEICRFLKEKDSQFPIIFLTSRGDELDKIYGLQLGAWDYQTKPVSLEFLITRIKSLFQIKSNTFSANQNDNTKHIGDISIDDASMTVQWKNAPINLTPTEFDILSAILQTPEGVSIEDLV
ncbi:MAG: response regulator, partial [Gammaproteobacteria bacterium]|nr:response regulator [Gammaproteobacteria bacterium]